MEKSKMTKVKDKKGKRNRREGSISGHLKMIDVSS